MGGPPTYSETRRSQTRLLRMHAGNGDMGDLGERFVRCFEGALEDAGPPADRAFRTAMVACMRWAVDDVLAYSPVDAVVPRGAEMPLWGWDGMQDR